MRNLILTSIFVISTSISFAQHTAQDFLSGDEIVWYGLDFSKAKFIGAFDQGAGAAPVTGYELKTKYMLAWNMLIVNESAKYDLKRTLKKTSVFNDLSIVEKTNSKIDDDKIMSFNDYKFDDADKTINSIINGYAVGEKKQGIGVVFIVESFNKGQQQGTVYVTIFDIKTKKVLIKEKIIGKAGGIGIRNYWAKSIFNVMVQVEKTFYKQWKKNNGI